MKRSIDSLLLLIAMAVGAVATAGGQAQADTRFLIPQTTATDCGPAALATLLNYYLDVPSSEAEMVRLTRSRPGIGTTFLRLEEAAVAKGCAADSFRMSYPTLRQQLATYPSPVIVRTLLPEPHFSVLLGITEDCVFLADPAKGNILLRPSSFLSRWYIPGTQQGFVFIVASPDGHVNTAHQNQVVTDLATQLQHLKTSRPRIDAFRH